ncbi:hypothetical protein KFL_004710060 [Klebsormidium nitens]|uniref:Uncharacterized protein n=1 Tax=Klebsormidium nitens TaxID=105231 RepID=A0A1Y1IJX2_KLENI|nr:hypothetical protein KFL_004710060 [Klebsormidium nitens]|eukprot:GAQ88937.1 hypothetical protein KFL_004710060 [Klebsormidium nitens]
MASLFTGSFLHPNTTAELAAQARQLLEPYHDGIRKVGRSYSMVPLPYMLAMHSLFVSSFFRGAFNQYWLIGYWMAFCAGFGGGTLSSLFLAELPVWLQYDFILVIFSVCWYLMIYCPGDLVFKLYNNLPARAACRVASSVLKAHTIAAGVTHAVKVCAPGVVVSPLLLGTLGGCGGVYLTDIVLYNMGLRKPMEFSYPTWNTWSSFVIAFLYLSTVHWLPILPQDVAEALGITFLVAQALASEFTGLPLDCTAPIDYVFHVVTGIPRPADVLKGAEKSAAKAPPTVGQKKKAM